MEDDEGLNTDDLAINLFDFLLAGTETSSTTLKWVVLYLTLHQEVQDRCRAEIREVIGDRKCGLEDIQRLPYTQVSGRSHSMSDCPLPPGDGVGGSEAGQYRTPGCGSPEQRLRQSVRLHISSKLDLHV